jgi:hypothetical protein
MVKSNKSGQFKKKRGLLLSWGCLLLLSAWMLTAGWIEAAYLRNVPQTLIQPDGSTLH